MKKLFCFLLVGWLVLTSPGIAMAASSSGGGASSPKALATLPAMYDVCLRSKYYYIRAYNLTSTTDGIADTELYYTAFNFDEFVNTMHNGVSAINPLFLCGYINGGQFTFGYVDDTYTFRTMPNQLTRNGRLMVAHGGALSSQQANYTTFDSFNVMSSTFATNQNVSAYAYSSIPIFWSLSDLNTFLAQPDSFPSQSLYNGDIAFFNNVVVNPNSPDINISGNGITDFINNGFGLFGQNNGFFALLARSFSFLPSDTISLVNMGVAVSICIIIYKLWRG